MLRFDTVVRNGMIIDGTRAPRYRADIGIKDGRIAEIGKHLRDADGDSVSITRSWRLNDGSSSPQRWCDLYRRKSAESMMALPGAKEAAAACALQGLGGSSPYPPHRSTHKAGGGARSPANKYDRVERDEARKRLRLVVDNTRTGIGS